MATEIHKDVLLPGSYRLPDGRRVTYTRADCANVLRQGRAMLKAGLRVPCCWEHDPDAEPMQLSHPSAWLARGYFGEVKDFFLHSGGRVRAKISIPDEKDARQFLKVGTVSPRVDFDWRDETGKVWRGLTVGHIAATARPVQRHQDRVAMLSHTPVEFVRGPGRGITSVYLSHNVTSEGQAMGNGDVDTAMGGLDAACEYLRRVGIELGEPENWPEFLRALDAATATASGKSGQGGDGPETPFTAGAADLSHTITGRRPSRPTRGEAAVIAEQERLARQYSVPKPAKT